MKPTIETDKEYPAFKIITCGNQEIMGHMTDEEAEIIANEILPHTQSGDGG